MSDEREVRVEKDFWGNERENIYKDGKKIGEYKKEERGGFLGIGAETHKVEYDNNRNEIGYTKKEQRGGFLGMGAEPVEARYDPDGQKAGYSKVEERGGFLEAVS